MHHETQEQKTPTLENRIEHANQIVRKRVFASMGAGLIPVPIFDFVALTGIQMDLVRALCKLYEIPFRKDVGKTVVATLVGGALPVSASPTLASLVKTIPLIGTTTGAVTLSIVGGATTYAIGKVFIQHFEAGGNLLNFNPEKMKAYFSELYKEGEKVATEASGTN